MIEGGPRDRPWSAQVGYDRVWTGTAAGLAGRGGLRRVDEEQVRVLLQGHSSPGVGVVEGPGTRRAGVVRRQIRWTSARPDDRDHVGCFSWRDSVRGQF